jgi:hypothetical protein
MILRLTPFVDVKLEGRHIVILVAAAHLALFLLEFVFPGVVISLALKLVLFLTGVKD